MSAHDASRAAARLVEMRTSRPDWSGADHRTTIADCLTALCAATGVALDDIDPASGFNTSDRAYQTVRESWRDYVRQHGLSEQYDRPNFERAVATWRRLRPDLTEGDDWLAGIPQRGGRS